MGQFEEDEKAKQSRIGPVYRTSGLFGSSSQSFAPSLPLILVYSLTCRKGLLFRFGRGEMLL